MPPFDLKLLRRLPDRIRNHLELGMMHSRLKTPCVLWLGPRRSRNEYGRVYHRRKERVVHRVVYELLVAPVDDCLVIDHLCRDRRCVAPWHHEPVTVRVNTHRGDAKLFKRRCEYAT